MLEGMLRFTVHMTTQNEKIFMKSEK